MGGWVSRLCAPLLVMCLAGLAGCGGFPGLPDASDPADIAARTEISHDRYDGLWKARAPRIAGFINRDIRSYRLRAGSARPSFGQDAVAQLYVVADLDDWLYLRHAHSAGVAYEVEKIDREHERCGEEPCDHIETIGINMSIDQLRVIAASPGFDVRISGRKGDIYLFVPSAYFRGFLRAIGQTPL